MNRVFLVCCAVALCFISAQALDCYECKIGFWNLCATSKTTCSSNQRCFSGEGKAVGFLNIKMKGCLDVEKCNKMEVVHIAENAAMYNMTKTCCATDLCNSAPGRAHVSAVGMILAAVGSLITVKVLM